MLPGMGGVQAGASARTQAGVMKTYASTFYGQNNDALSVDVPIGAEPLGGATRHVFVYWGFWDNDIEDNPGTSTLTLDGVTYEYILNASGSSDGNSSGNALLRWEKPTGTTATFSSNVSSWFGGTMDDYDVGVFVAYNLDTTSRTVLDVSADTHPTLTITTPSGGFSILVGRRGTSQSTCTPWSGSSLTNILATGSRTGGVAFRSAAGSSSHQLTNGFGAAAESYTFTT